MFDKKFLDFTLVGEYFILVAVYLTFFLFAIDFSVGKKSGLFSVCVPISFIYFFSVVSWLFEQQLPSLAKG